jgi:hypothetical protein
MRQRVRDNSPGLEKCLQTQPVQRMMNSPHTENKNKTLSRFAQIARI